MYLCTSKDFLMQKISPDSILSDLILQYPSLVPVMYLAGICGDFNGKAVRQVCKDNAINEDYLLNLLKAFTDEKFVPTATLPSYSVLQLSALLSARYPFFLDQFDFLTKEILKNLMHERMMSGKHLMQSALKDLFASYRLLLSTRLEQQNQTVNPHIATVYELYYSPDYTSERSDILNYSLEFYDGRIDLLRESFAAIRKLLQKTLEFRLMDLRYASNVFAFYQLNNDLLVQDRVEQKLLRPLVLQMEESIITTFHKKNKVFGRNNFLSLPVVEKPSNLLTSREKEVLRLVAKGLMNKEIADQLNIGLTTVISHRKNIVEKLRIKTIPGLTVYAYTHGYIDDFLLTNED